MISVPFAGIGGSGKGVLDMNQIVRFCARLADGGMNDLSTDDIAHWQLRRSRRFPPGGDLQEESGLGAVANVLKLLPFSQALSHRQVLCFALECLNPSHFIDADSSFSRFGSN